MMLGMAQHVQVLRHSIGRGIVGAHGTFDSGQGPFLQSTASGFAKTVTPRLFHANLPWLPTWAVAKAPFSNNPVD